MAKKSYETYSTLGEQIDNASKGVTYDPNRDYSSDLKKQIASGADYNTVYNTLAARINKADNTDGLSQYAWDSTTRDAINYLLTFHETPSTYIDAAEAAEATRQYDRDLAAGAAQPGELADRVAALEKPIGQTTPAVQQTASKPTTTPIATTTAPVGSSSSSASSSDYSDYLEEMYKAQKEAGLAALKAAYDKNVATVDAAGNRIPGVYNAARNQTAATAAQTQRNFNQQATAAGLGSGTSAQAQLANSVTLQNNLNALNEAEASALAELELQRTNLSTEYENAVAQAEANGNYELAAALYEEAVRMDEYLAAQEAALRQQQQKDYNDGLEMAQYLFKNSGDASGLKAYGYTDDQIANLEAGWRSENTPKAPSAPEYKPNLTVNQVLEAIKNGITSDAVLKAYEYYYGQPYKTERQSMWETVDDETIKRVEETTAPTLDKMLAGATQFQNGGLYNALIGSKTPVKTGYSDRDWVAIRNNATSYLQQGDKEGLLNYVAPLVPNFNENQTAIFNKLLDTYGWEE